MRYFVTASIAVVIACVVIPNCYALETSDNGYAWNSSDYKDKIKVCKFLANVNDAEIGKDYRWWLVNLNDAFTPPSWLLNKPISFAAVLIVEYQEAQEKYGR